jgi:hypothetical protein
VIPGFFNAYRAFKTLDELEVFIRAHLCLLEFSIETVAETGAAYLPIAWCEEKAPPQFSSNGHGFVAFSRGH